MEYLIIGNGVAGTTAAEKIRNLDAAGEIHILTEETAPFYSRIRLIDYLAGEASLNDITIHKEEWYNKMEVSLSLGSKIVDIDSEKHTVRTHEGETIQYDKLLIASGGVSFIPPIAGSHKRGVFALRTISDADAIIDFVNGKKKVILVGGGVLGLEAGNSLRKRGLEITVVEVFPRLLPRQMDLEGAELLKAQLESMGFVFYLGVKIKEILGSNKASGVMLEDDSQLNGDIIIFSAGIRPRTELATKLGLTGEKGVLVNDRMETKKQDIYAAGDMIEHKDKSYGIWKAAYEQGEIAGINMAGGDRVYNGTTMSNILKVLEVNLAAAGEIDADGKFESIVNKDPSRYTYRKLVIDSNRIIGCILYGDTEGFGQILNAIENKKDISNMREKLMQWNLRDFKVI